MAIGMVRIFRAPSVLTGIFIGMLSVSAHAANLTVIVDGLRNAKGTVRIELDGSEAAWDDKAEPAGKGDVKATVGSVSYTFTGVPPGTYGLGVFQDEDDSGKLHTNFLGIPKEGYGFSNNPSVMRLPTFKEVQFAVEQEDASVLIHLKYGI